VTYTTKEPVVLEGYQSIFSPNKFGKCSLTCIIGDELVEQLEKDRPAALEWARDKAKSKRVNVKLEPWEPVADGKYKITLRWNPDHAFPIIDADTNPITEEIPLYSGSTVKVAFDQRPYAMADAIGTSLRIKALQVITCNTGKAADIGSLDEKGAADLFGKTEGFNINEANIVVKKEEDEDDF
jgi:hypothetical protein